MARLGVRSALLAGVLFASGAPLAGFWFWPYSAVVENEMREVYERHSLLARTLADALDRYNEDVRTLFLSVAAPIARGEPAALAEAPLKAQNFRHLCVAEAETGRVVRAFLAETSPCPEIIPEARLVLFRALLDQGDGTISTVATPDDGGPPRLFVAARHEDLLVVGALGLERFEALADAVAFGQNGHALIVDAEGRLMAHPRPDWVEEGRYLDNVEPVRRVMAGGEGVARFVAPALEQEVVAGFAAGREAGWGVMVVEPVAEIERRAANDRRTVLLVFLIGLGLSAAVAYAIADFVARAVDRVSRAAALVAAGATGVRLAPGGGALAIREFETLGARFDALAGRVDAVEAEAAAIARTDELTGLLDRGAFLKDAERALRTASECEGLTLYFIDVDRLKAINDAFGHAVGDALLQTMGGRLRAAAPADALVARQGGDEFLALCRGASPEAAAEFATMARTALSRAIDYDGRLFMMSTSIGASFWPRDARNLTRLISNADRAMYAAKQSGRNQFRLFDDALRNRAEESDSLRRALQCAIAQEGIGVAFQPVTETRTGRLLGFEALARWSPDGSQVSPERFVKLAEETGLISDLGRQVRARAMGFAAELKARGLDLPIAINVSETELFNLGFAAEFIDALGRAGLPPSAIILEITESNYEKTSGCDVAGLQTLRDIGLSLALDDFGKGFSSYRRLQAYPVDRLKIDLAFYGDVANDPRAQAVVRSLIGLGRSLGLTVTVEGVETAALQKFAERLGADECQGFWRHPPLSPADALALASHDPPEAVAARG